MPQTAPKQLGAQKPHFPGGGGGGCRGGGVIEKHYDRCSEETQDNIIRGSVEKVDKREAGKE